MVYCKNNKDIRSITDSIDINDINLFKKILKYRYNSNAKDIKDDTGNPLIFHILTLNRSPFLIELLKYGADINEVDKYRSTPLFLTVMGSNMEMFYLLLKHGADVNKCNPLCYAIYTDKIDIIDLLIDYSDTQNLNEAVKFACSSDQTDLFLKLINAGADVKQLKYDEYDEDELPLQYAIENKNVVIFRELVRRGTDLNRCSHYTEPPLHLAIRLGRIKMAYNLIRHGVDVNLVHEDWSRDMTNYSTPISKCIYKRNIDMLNTLLDNGAHINGHKKVTSYLNLAVFVNNIEIVRILIKRGININQTAYIQAPLYNSIQERKLDIARELVLSGASIYSERMKVWDITLFDTAKERGVYDDLVGFIDQKKKLFKIQGLCKIYKCKKMAYMLRLEPENLFDPEFSEIRKQKLEIDSSKFKNS